MSRAGCMNGFLGSVPFRSVRLGQPTFQLAIKHAKPMAILFFSSLLFSTCFFLSFPELTTKCWLPRSDTYREHTVTCVTQACVWEREREREGEVLWHFHAPSTTRRRWWQKEMHTMGRRGVVNAQKRFRPQSRPGPATAPCNERVKEVPEVPEVPELPGSRFERAL